MPSTHLRLSVSTPTAPITHCSPQGSLRGLDGFAPCAGLGDPDRFRHLPESRGKPEVNQCTIRPYSPPARKNLSDAFDTSAVLFLVVWRICDTLLRLLRSGGNANHCVLPVSNKKLGKRSGFCLQWQPYEVSEGDSGACASREKGCLFIICSENVDDDVLSAP